MEIQIREIIDKVALPQKWADDWYKWLDEDEKEEQKLAEKNVKKLKLELETLDKKLNILLDSFLDQVIDNETYRKKKNELFEEKLKIAEEITKIQTNGSSWLEPMREFVGSALSCAKIACAENNCHDLAVVAKKVGSNFFLKEHRLSATLDFPFAALSAEAGAASAAPTSFAISKMVNFEFLISNQIIDDCIQVFKDWMTIFQEPEFKPYFNFA